MGVMASFAWKTMLKNKVRTFVTIIGIALSAALITAIFACVSSLEYSAAESVKLQDGTWCAEVSTHDAKAYERALEDDRVESVATAQTVGFLPLDRKVGGNEAFLPFVSFSGDFETLLAVNAKEGQLPRNSHEVMLPMSWKDTTALSEKPCALGDQVELSLVSRVVNQEVTLDRGDEQVVLPAGTPLSAYDGLTNVESNKDRRSAFEDLVPQEKQTYTVVGFYDYQNSATTNSYLGSCAVTVNRPTAASITNESAAKTIISLSVFDIQSQEHLNDVMNELFPNDKIALHNSLLMYQGYMPDRSFFDSIYNMALILSIVIFFACVSLIYNAFAISVGERMRMFGLLSSIGATRRQLRYSVFFEAFVLAIIGIPLGLAIGVLGTMGVWLIIGPELNSVFSYGINPDRVANFSVHVYPKHLVFVSFLTALIVLVSAWVPSKKASRVSAIDALRGVQETRKIKAKKARRFIDARAWGAHGIDLMTRVFGVSGALAKRNITRRKGRNAATTVSLSLAIMLLISAGSLTTYISYLIENTYPDYYDYQVSAYVVGEDNVSVSSVDALYEKLDATKGVEGIGWNTSSKAYVEMPEGYLNADFLSLETRGEAMSFGKVENSTIKFVSNTLVVDDASFAKYAAEAGLSDAQLQAALQGDAIPCLGIAHATKKNGSKYEIQNEYLSTGDFTLYTLKNGTIASQLFYWDGTFSVANGGDSEPISKTNTVAHQANLVGLVDTLPSGMFGDMEPALILPKRALEVLGPTTNITFYRFNVPEGDTTAASEALERVFEKETVATYYVADLTGSLSQLQKLYTIVEVFCFAFALILLIIAIANVFNTIANGLVLRTREFAMLKSVGMSNRDFRHMVIVECITYVIHGLIIGLALSFIVMVGLYQSMLSAIEGPGVVFIVPWTYVVGAILIVVVTIAVSMMYGLRKARSTNVVEALKLDVM